jgi:copper transport protein
MLKPIRSLARPGCAFALAVLVAAVAPAFASAHAGFVESEPAPGTELQAGPGQITLGFTEPLNRGLTEATVINAETAERIPSELSFPAERELRLVPGSRLERDPYRVEWRTVSTVDGHALEGSFGFGVGVPAIESEGSVEQSPLARGGWVRIAARLLLYASLFFFAGGVFAAAVLSRRGGPGRWLYPALVSAHLASAGESTDALAERAWRRTLDAGWLAAAAAVGVAAVEALDAAGGLSASGLYDFLLTNSAGLARLGTVLLVLLAAALASRLQIAASATLALAFLTIAISGHAYSAELRGLAVLTDWVHLVAGAVWVGGIAQVGWAWVPLARRVEPDGRRAAMRSVLGRFGLLGLPAFLLVAATGLTNALIQLGEVPALWETAYGRVLAVKIALVGAIAVVSYLHAIRLRPRLLAGNPHAPERRERRHWRLLSAEPALGVLVAAAAAALVAFPLPPQQLAEGEVAEAAACSPCPVPQPRADELAVADDAGSRVVAFWLRREGDLIEGTLRVHDSGSIPAEAAVRMPGAELEDCGVGCLEFSLPGSAERVTAFVEEDGREYRASVPARWRAGASREARRLLAETERTMRSLASLREVERLSGGPGTALRTRYVLRAPNRFAYRNSAGWEAVIVGARRWSREGNGPWEAGPFGAGDPFRSSDFFRWTPYASVARLIGVRREEDRRVAVVATMNGSAPPIWFRLRIDLGSMRTLADAMTTSGHFMERRYFAFNRPVVIEPPPAAEVER